MATTAIPLAMQRRSALRRRRRLAYHVAVASALAAVAVWTTASFAQSAPRTMAPVARVLQLSAGVRLPAGVRSLRYSTAAPDGRLRWRSPGWRVEPDEPVAVATAGDLAFVDARGRTAVTLTLHVANLPALRYRSFTLPVAVWAASRPLARSSWHRVPAARGFVDDADGRIRFRLPGGCYYDVTLERGGSIVALPGSGGYGPSFYTTLS